MITKQDLLDDLQAFESADEEHATARAATLAAKDNTASVTAVEQSLVDQANAHKQQAVTEAKTAEDAAVSEEEAASAAENTAKAKLFSDLQEFAAQQ